MTDVLIVCRANQCRSPFAAAIGNRLAAGQDVQFRSAGFLPGGRAMPEKGIRVGRERGFDFSDHRSSELRLGDLDQADLILTMTRSQARHVLLDRPNVWPRVFTVKQFSRWVGVHSRPEGVDVRSWLEVQAAERPRSSLLGASAVDDVADPVRARMSGWRRVADELETHLRAVVEALLVTDAAGRFTTDR